MDHDFLGRFIEKFPGATERLVCFHLTENFGNSGWKVNGKVNLRGGGGDSAYERGGNARRKFWIKPLKETDLGVAQVFFLTPKRDHVKTQTILYFLCFSRATLNETFTAKYYGVSPRTPQVRTKSEIYTPKRDDEYPHPFHMRSSPGVTFRKLQPKVEVLTFWGSPFIPVGNNQEPLWLLLKLITKGAACIYYLKANALNFSFENTCNDQQF